MENILNSVQKNLLYSILRHVLFKPIRNPCMFFLLVAGQELNAIQPKNRKEKEENLIKIFNFMKNNGIQLHLLSVEGILNVH